MPLSKEQKEHLSKTLKERGICPSPEARAKAAEVSRAKPRKIPGPCTTDGCARPANSKGLCKPCYDRSRKHDPAVKSRKRQIIEEHIAKDPDFYKRGNIKKYGITFEDFVEMVEEQMNLCKICSTLPEGNTKQSSVLHVDHCHDTGRVRRLLCFKCNTAIGSFMHDIKRLKAARAYLIKHGAKEPDPSTFAAF